MIDKGTKCNEDTCRSIWCHHKSNKQTCLLLLYTKQTNPINNTFSLFAFSLGWKPERDSQHDRDGGWGDWSQNQTTLWASTTRYVNKQQYLITVSICLKWFPATFNDCIQFLSFFLEDGGINKHMTHFIYTFAIISNHTF